MQPSTAMQQPWNGRLWLATDHCLFEGQSGDTRPHAHYAHQILLVDKGELGMKIAGKSYQGSRLVVPSLQQHAFCEAGQPLLALYLEPQAFHLQTLQAWLAKAPCEPQAVLAQLRHWSRPALDGRVQQTLQTIDALLLERIDANALASRAHISLSQLERLFGHQVGLPVRKLILWRRLRLALSLVLRGSNLTEAAHAANFADQAHFSRTLRGMFGIQGQTLRQLQLQLLD